MKDFRHYFLLIVFVLKALFRDPKLLECPFSILLFWEWTLAHCPERGGGILIAFTYCLLHSFPSTKWKAKSETLLNPDVLTPIKITHLKSFLKEIKHNLIFSLVDVMAAFVDAMILCKMG